MWRILLIGLGAYSGYRLAKMGESRYNFVLATMTAALAYKLTQARMKSTGEVAENGKQYLDVEAEVVEET